jgi:hypothetical protein
VPDLPPNRKVELSTLPPLLVEGGMPP